MIRPATVPLRAVRTNALVVPITIRGIDLTSAELSAMVLQNWDNDPEDPEIEPTVTLEGVEDDDGTPVSSLTFAIPLADMAAVGAGGGEIGSDLKWVWMLDIQTDTGDDDTKQRYFEGPFIIGGSAGGAGAAGTITATITDQTISVVIDGASALGPLVASATASAALAQEWADNPEDDAVTGNPGKYSAKHWSAKAEDFAATSTASAGSAASSEAAAAALVAGLAGIVLPKTYPVPIPDFDAIDYAVDADGECRVVADAGANGIRTFESPQDPTILRSSTLYALLGVESVYPVPDFYPWANVFADSDGDLRVEATVSEDDEVLHYQDNLTASDLNAEGADLPTAFVAFTIAGQSNAIGRGTSGPDVEIPAGIAFAYNPDTGDLEAYLGDPLPSVAALAAQGSAWASFAVEFNKLTGKGVVFVQTAYSGASQMKEAENPDGTKGTWDSSSSYGGTLHRAIAVTRTQDMLAELTAQGWEWEYGGFLWVQGEGDSGYVGDPDEFPTRENLYLTAFETMLTYFQTQLGFRSVNCRLPFYLSLTKSSERGIERLQRVLSQRHENVMLMYTAAPGFGDRSGFMNGDGIHYEQPGLNELGRFGGRRAARNH